MKIKDIIERLKSVDDSYQLLCILSKINIKSRIYVVGQLKENVPGVCLGDREPYLREKTVGIFVEELKTFGDSFQNNDFLMEFDHLLADEEYESRYFQLTDIEVINDEVLLYSNMDELIEFRETNESS